MRLVSLAAGLPNGSEVEQEKTNASIYIYILSDHLQHTDDYVTH